MNNEIKEKRLQIFGDWYDKLKNVIESNEFNNLSNWIRNERETKYIYPNSSDIFRAFSLCQYKDVKVIVIAQSPFFYSLNNQSVANGLAFGSSIDSHEPVPLKLINDSIEKEERNGLYLDRDFSLQYLANQGVLLLNRTLTTEKNSAEAHEGKWDFFTREVIKQLNKHPNRLAFLLIGAKAKEIENKLIDRNWHLVIDREHPSFSARQNREWFSNNCWSEINNFLENIGKSKIKW